MPGDAMFPGSTSFSVTMPSKGAAIVVKESVVLAWSPAARALSTADAACKARADAPATRASALRSVAVASSSSCAVADRLACRPAMRSWDARARARPASAARSSAAAAFDPCSAARAADARGTGAGGEIVAVEHDERLALADPIAWRHADLAHRRQDARRDRGRGAGLHHAARIDRAGHVGHRDRAVVTAMGAAASAGAAAAWRGEHPASAALDRECRRHARNDDVMTRGDRFHGLPIARCRVAVAVSTFTRAAICWASACCTASAERSSMAASVRPLS